MKSDRTGVGRRFLARAGIAGLAIAAAVAGVIAGAVLLDLHDLARFVPRIPGPQPKVDRPKPGRPQTLMILGSDARYGDKRSGNPARSDTILLVRLDADAPATTVMSIPRDLKVPIPGLKYPDKINAAYANGGPAMTLATVKDLLSAPKQSFEVSHVVNVSFAGFRRAVDYVGGVYVDVDRHYFNDRGGPGGYATLDIPAGYQRLSGTKALDYVRFRHTDGDLARATRQQDFIRQVKSQDRVRALTDFGKRKTLARIFGRYFQADSQLRTPAATLSLIKLVLGTSGKPIQEVPFRISREDPSYLYTTPDLVRTSVHDFLHPEAVAARPATTPKRVHPIRRQLSLRDIRRAGEDRAALGQRHLDFPLYFPAAGPPGAQYDAPAPRTYTLVDEQGRRHAAYRLVLADAGHFYGIQGTSWREPPLLAGPHETVHAGGRRLRVYLDGRRVRLVAWSTPSAVYWVANDLQKTLGQRELVAIAASLRRLRG